MVKEAEEKHAAVSARGQRARNGHVTSQRIGAYFSVAFGELEFSAAPAACSTVEGFCFGRNRALFDDSHHSTSRRLRG
jgi:hypothetical protein